MLFSFFSLGKIRGVVVSAVRHQNHRVYPFL